MTVDFLYCIELLGHRGVHLISHKRLSWLLDVLLEDSREGSGLSAIESSQGSHPFYSLFIKALLFQLSYDTVPWYRMSGGLFVSSRFLHLLLRGSICSDLTGVSGGLQNL